MATRYLIGKGELLTYAIEAPKKEPGEKSRPYSLEEAKQVLLPQIEAANQAIAALPPEACPDDLAVAVMTLHPAYVAIVLLSQTVAASKRPAGNRQSQPANPPSQAGHQKRTERS